MNLIITLLLFYAAAVSRNQSSRIYGAWLLLAIAQTSFLLGDISWGFFDLRFYFQDTIFANFLYIIYYLFFISGILFLSSEIFKSKNRVKIILDILIVVTSAALIFLTLLILPLVSSMNRLNSEFIIALIYVFLDFALFVALISLLYRLIDKNGQTTLFLLALGLFFQIITDFIYSYSIITGTYISGNPVDIGWVIGYIFVGLAAVSQIRGQRIDFNKFIPENVYNLKKYDLGIYIPIILVLFAYISQIWGYNNIHSNYLISLDYGVAILVFLILIRQIVALKENKSLYGAARAQITKRKIIEKELQKSEKKYRGIVENANEGILSANSEGIIIFSNHRFAEMMGYEENELMGMSIFSLMDDKSLMDAKKCFIDLKTGKKGQIELKFMKKNGKFIYVLNNVSPLMDNNEYKGCLALISDITESKKAEKIIKQSLTEKEILLREIHHRVKNNMQIISSMLSLQSNYLDNEEIKEILNESRNRVKSMALAHEKIYKSDNMDQINIKDYIEDTFFYLISSYALNLDLIHFKIDSSVFKFNIDTAVPLGLIINELLTNSLKYAFPDIYNPKSKSNEFSGSIGNISNTKYEIKVQIKGKNDKYQLIIKDNGVGLPKDFDWDNIPTLGLNIVDALVQQINGTIEVLETSGTAFIIVFEEIINKKD